VAPGPLRLDLTPTIQSAVAKPVPTHENTEEEQTCISILSGFEPTIPMFERAKMFHALDSATFGFVNILRV
jgi:hypothetical protein